MNWLNGKIMEISKEHSFAIELKRKNANMLTMDQLGMLNEISDLIHAEHNSMTFEEAFLYDLVNLIQFRKWNNRTKEETYQFLENLVNRDLEKITKIWEVKFPYISEMLEGFKQEQLEKENL
jgi:hypothetical protein